MGIILLSPSKTMDVNAAAAYPSGSRPFFQAEAGKLMVRLQGLTPAELQATMALSPALAEATHQLLAGWKTRGSSLRPACLLYRGDTFDGLQADDWTADQQALAHGHLGIVSGLYGLLRAYDLISPYRLEMKYKFADGSGGQTFWKPLVTKALLQNQVFTGSGPHNLLFNLTSGEYSAALDLKALTAAGWQVFTPQFEDETASGYKTVSVFAKRARGRFASWLLSRPDLWAAPDQLWPQFAADGYAWQPSGSDPVQPLYRRPLARE